MAPAFAIVGVVAAAVGGIASAAAQSSALRRQASQRKLEGEQELLAARRRVRQELGQDLVAAGGSGLLGSSFDDVFQSQAILDAEFLSQIKQRTDFDVSALKSQAKNTLLVGVLSAGASAFSGIAGARQGAAQLKATRDLQSRISSANAAQRSPTTGGNIFQKTSGPGTTSPVLLRRTP